MLLLYDHSDNIQFLCGCGCIILAWHTNLFRDVHDYLHSKRDLSMAGPFVIGVLAFFLVCFVFSGFYIKGIRSQFSEFPEARSYASFPGSLYAAATDSKGR